MPLFTRKPGFPSLEGVDQLEPLVQASHVRPVLILKHSPACGTSVQALDELDEKRDQLAAVDVHVVDVLRQRPLSQMIATRFGVRHESPQALLLINGQLQWNGSHFRVTVEAINRAVARSGQPQRDVLS